MPDQFDFDAPLSARAPDIGVVKVSLARATLDLIPYFSARDGRVTIDSADERSAWQEVGLGLPVANTYQVALKLAAKAIEGALAEYPFPLPFVS